MTILILFLVLNPGAVATIWSLRDTDARAGEDRRLAAIVAVAASAGLVLAVVLASPVLDALDISDSTFMIVAGTLVIFGAFQAFLGFGLRHELPSDGWLIAGLLIWLLSPPALAAAAAVEIGEGIGPGLVAAVAGAFITVCAGFLWMRQVGVGKPILLGWLRRVIAAGAVIGGVELIRQGTLSI